MSDHFETEGVEWRPQLSAEGERLAEQVRADLVERANLFRQVRKMLNVPQARAAEVLATSQANISKIEARGRIDIAQLQQFAEAFGAKLHLVLEKADGEKVEIAA
jgi:transcriptional regulator